MQKIKEHLRNSILVKEALLKDEAIIDAIENAINLLANAFGNGHKLLLCGNGGSACDAMHIAEELTGNYNRNRKPLPAIPLTDAGHLTCTANDFGFEMVFARAVEAYGQANDILLAISTSGNSQNVLNAAEVAKQKGMKVIAFTGENGGLLASKADIIIQAPSTNTAHIQEAHITIGHLIIEGIEDLLFFT